MLAHQVPTQVTVFAVGTPSLHILHPRAPQSVLTHHVCLHSASFVLGWICFVISLVSGVIFLYTSGKKKKRPEGNATEGTVEAEDDFDDEPQIMGR